jgi:hypothetical protein
VKVAIIMMQKNEDELVNKWADFHGALFGYENLYIYDNGSTSTESIRALNSLERLGCNINRENNTKKDFEAKGEIIGNKIKELEALNKYDFYFPLDCDEFLGVVNNKDEASFDIEAIEAELSKYVGSKEVLVNKVQFFNSPISKVHFRYIDTRKCFFYKGNFKSLDIGFHWGKNKHSESEIKTNIIQVHIHQKPFEEIKKYALQKLSHRLDVDDLNKLKTYKGAGTHLTKYFFMNEFTYLKDIIKKNHVHSNAIAKKFEAFSILWPYEDKLKAPNLFVNKHNLSNFTQPRVEHEVIRGGLDMFTLKDSNIQLRGWAINANKEPATHYSLLINDSICITANTITSVSRPDVEDKQNVTNVDLGFLIEFDLSELINNYVYINTLALHPSHQINAIGSELSVENQKVKDILEKINNLDYRNEHILSH